MSATVTQPRAWSIALWVIRVLVAIPFFIAAWLEGMSPPETLAALDLVWIPDAPLWLVRLVAGIEGLAALGLILPGLVRLPPMVVTAAALVLVVVQIAALGFDLTAGSLGDLPVKAVVLALTLIILWARLGRPSTYAPPP
ncbi:MAG: DoxX family protein [Tabrizicola sp.]